MTAPRAARATPSGVPPAPAHGDEPLHRAIVALASERVPATAVVRAVPGPVRRDLAAVGFRMCDDAPSRAVDAAVVTADELGGAGEHAEALLASVVDGLRPGGLLLAAFPNALIEAPGSDRHRSWRPTDVRRFLGSRGVLLERLWGPGAHARVNGLPLAFDDRFDGEPGLVGAAAALLALARAPATPSERSEVFFATLPTKVLAAATLTRRRDGRLLIVHDTFKGHWTIPGGVVDADEHPEDAAVRETREESGVDVRPTGLVGVFHGTRPDRLLLLFSAEPTGQRGDDPPGPIHTHEVDAAAWVPIDEALRRVAAPAAEQIDRGVNHPGGMWRLN